MKSKEYIDKIRHLIWLQGIASEYEKHIASIKKDQNYFRVFGISYACLGDVTTMEVNSNFFPASSILQGLTEGLKSVNEEITELKKELKSLVVELE